MQLMSRPPMAGKGLVARLVERVGRVGRGQVTLAMPASSALGRLVHQILLILLSLYLVH